MILIVLGLLSAVALFYKLSKLPKEGCIARRTLSIVIPARNEEKNIGLLLNDLHNQTVPPFEILCVDDCSDDDTAQVALKKGAVVIKAGEKPKGWNGKTWACQQGSKKAGGDLLLFLDADVRLGPCGIERLLYAYEEYGGCISVQPYHKAERRYEQFSLFFNLIAVAANAVGKKLRRFHAGLFGPVILMSKEDFKRAGGYTEVKSSIVEDISLGAVLKKAGIKSSLFLGDTDVSYRMYSGGFSCLWQGWTKNFASGVQKTHPLILALVFLAITSCTSTVIKLLVAVSSGNVLSFTVAGFFYLLWVIAICYSARQIGSFRYWSKWFYPLTLFLFFSMFLTSVYQKLFLKKAVWKGRTIGLGRD